MRKLGRYEIMDELGQGAMGIVYRATDPMINRVVAIKTINMALRDDEVAEYEARFYQEAKAAGGLNHPNIVTVYDIGKSGNIAFMTMEFLQGKELRALLVPGVPLPVAQALDIGAQVADGLAYAHRNQVVHRDIKPANIMIVGEGVVKITDFGIARMRFSKTFTHTGTIVGSPRYMSPEQVLGKRTGPQSDIFSLGAVLYEMLTGRAPFTGNDVNALMFQILNLVVAKAIAKAPDERYADAAELAADLRECRKQIDEAGPAVASAAVPAQAKIDQESSVSLLGDDLPGTRRDDVEHSPSDPAPTLGVAKSFDSLEATLRFAAQTGMMREIEEYARTHRMQPEPERFHEGGQETAGSSRRARVAPTQWTRKDRLIFATGIAAALIVATGIAFL